VWQPRAVERAGVNRRRTAEWGATHRWDPLMNSPRNQGEERGGENQSESIKRLKGLQG
jgi:hypothetical protein